MMKNIFADLHIHVGISETGKWVKIPTSRTLTVRNILEHTYTCKGMHMVGIVDALSPLVQNDIKRLIDENVLVPLTNGGYKYKDCVTLLLGAEIETCEDKGGLSHTLIFLPYLRDMQCFSNYMSKYIKNINLSSQNAHMNLSRLINIAVGFEAAVIPAHVFTPHKSLYGACCRSLFELLDERTIHQITAVELGLSADSMMADRIKELANFTFVTNSDAHSLDKIAREYNLLNIEQVDYQEFVYALRRVKNRRIIANYGIDPRLGKYHGTQTSGSTKIVKGVAERIEELADFSTARHPGHRAQYCYQVPLEFIPGLGKKTINNLFHKFGTEMTIMHFVDYHSLVEVVGINIASAIIRVRKGDAQVIAGGGGKYGKLKK